jgi:hypothetical protein
MTSYAPTTIAALCFAKPTRIDFQSLTRNLGTTFAAAQAAGDCITAAHDDFVIYDLGRARVWLCYADFTADLSEALGAGGLPAEGLIVAVGPGPGAPASDPLYTDRADLCRGLAREINRAAPADHLMVFDHERMITSDIYDELVDLVGRLARPDAAHRTVTVAPFLSERPVIPGRHTPSEPPPPDTRGPVGRPHRGRCRRLGRRDAARRSRRPARGPARRGRRGGRHRHRNGRGALPDGWPSTP